LKTDRHLQPGQRQRRAGSGRCLENRERLEGPQLGRRARGAQVAASGSDEAIRGGAANGGSEPMPLKKSMLQRGVASPQNLPVGSLS
jgi:hypothetical protein